MDEEERAREDGGAAEAEGMEEERTLKGGRTLGRERKWELK